MKALGTLAWGVLLIVVDFRIDGFDVVVDPLGWLLAAVALWSLKDLHGGFLVGVIACVPGVVVSIPDLFAPLEGAAGLVEWAAQTALLVGPCHALTVTVPTVARRARHTRNWLIGLTLALLAGVVLTRLDSTIGPLVLVVGLALLVAVVAFVLLLFKAAKQPAPRRDSALRPT